jgi:hypothetical protein
LAWAWKAEMPVRLCRMISKAKKVFEVAMGVVWCEMLDVDFCFCKALGVGGRERTETGENRGSR